METIKLPEETIKDLTSLMQICREEVPDCVFSLVDTADNELWCSLPSTIIEEMEGGDEEYVLEIWDAKRTKRVAWFGVMPYEDDGVCWNYGGNELSDKIFKLFFERNKK